MARYKPDDSGQDALVPVCFDKQILPGTFEYALHHLLESKIDLSVFDQYYQNDATGARAYHPRVLLKIILFSYSCGLMSSRRIEHACRVNVQLMALSGEVKPDHSTLAAFVSRSTGAIQAAFKEILLVCDEAGLIGREMFAVDGVKLPLNASKDWSGRHEELAGKAKKLDRAVARLLDVHQREDAQSTDSDLFEHRERHIEKLTRQSDKIKVFLAKSEPKIGPSGKDRKSNITDNDSAKLATSKGVIQGYTGIGVVDDCCQIMVGAEAHGVAQEQELLQPVLKAVQESFQDLGLADNILSDTKYPRIQAFTVKPISSGWRAKTATPILRIIYSASAIRALSMRTNTNRPSHSLADSQPTISPSIPNVSAVPVRPERRCIATAPTSRSTAARASSLRGRSRRVKAVIYAHDVSSKKRSRRRGRWCSFERTKLQPVTRTRPG